MLKTQKSILSLTIASFILVGFSGCGSSPESTSSYESKCIEFEKEQASTMSQFAKISDSAIKNYCKCSAENEYNKLSADGKIYKFKAMSFTDKERAQAMKDIMNGKSPYSAEDEALISNFQCAKILKSGTKIY